MFHGVQKKIQKICRYALVFMCAPLSLSLVLDEPSAKSYLAIGHVKWIGMQKCAHHHKMQKELI